MDCPPTCLKPGRRCGSTIPMTGSAAPLGPEGFRSLTSRSQRPVAPVEACGQLETKSVRCRGSCVKSMDKNQSGRTKQRRACERKGIGGLHRPASVLIPGFMGGVVWAGLKSDALFRKSAQPLLSARRGVVASHRALVPCETA